MTIKEYKMWQIPIRFGGEKVIFWVPEYHDTNLISFFTVNIHFHLFLFHTARPLLSFSQPPLLSCCLFWRIGHTFRRLLSTETNTLCDPLPLRFYTWRLLSSFTLLRSGFCGSLSLERSHPSGHEQLYEALAEIHTQSQICALSRPLAEVLLSVLSSQSQSSWYVRVGLTVTCKKCTFPPQLRRKRSQHNIMLFQKCPRSV